jgi:hypothetical protein
MMGTVDILSCVGADIVMDLAVRIRGRTTRERDAKVELDEHLMVVEMVVEVEAGRENEAYRGNNKHL